MPKKVRDRPTYYRRLRVEHLEDRRLLATFTVSNLNDAGTGSLREAILLANANGEADSIDFLVTGTIDLESQLPAITENLTIMGPGASQLTLDAGNGIDKIFSTLDGYRIFEIDDGDVNNEIEVSIEGLTITGGDLQVNVFSAGGAIRSRENVTLVSSVVKGNAALDGGGIHHRFGTFTLIDSTVSHNVAFNRGGGAKNGVPADFLAAGLRSTLVVINSTISHNETIRSGGNGGGLSSIGDLYISESTFSSNIASGRGGGIDVRLTQDYLAESVIRNSTISGNMTGQAGGGIFNEAGTMKIFSSTITANSATDGGGGVKTRYGNSRLSNSIVFGNWNDGMPDNLEGGFSRNGNDYNLLGAGDTLNGLFGNTGVGNLFNIDPLLGPLADNGGPTKAHALLPGSPAIDAGDPSIAFDAGEFDQRGAPFSRVVVGKLTGTPVPPRIDIGAYEAQGPPSADFDGDFAVSGNDFLVWQRGFGTSNATPLDGDSDYDGDVDHSDLAAWRVSYGDTILLPPVVGLSAVSGQSSVVRDAESLSAVLAPQLVDEGEDEAEHLVESHLVDIALRSTELAAGVVSPASIIAEASEIVRDEASSVDESRWLADELLERVFG